jgi:hypothetical protein
MLLLNHHPHAQTNDSNFKTADKTTDTMKQIFIDKFLVPQNAKQEFIERLNINRNFIKKLPGFIQDAAYERTDEHGNLVLITIAVWENEAVLEKAKEAVQAEYKKQGFNLAEMMGRLHITIDRGIYKEEALQP